jgi:PBSX family phage portal protein
VATKKKVQGKPQLPLPKQPQAGSDGDDAVVSLIKAEILGGKESGSSILEYLVESDKQLPSGALPLPYDFKKLYTLFEVSSLLRPNVDAYVTNIDSFGHHFVPSIDLTSDKVNQRISDAIYYERMLEAREGQRLATDAEEPTKDEVEERRKQLVRIARIEYVRLRAFFSFVSPTLSFVELRRRMRQDLEVLGNGFWEVIRDKLGDISRLHYVRPLAMRLCKQDAEPAEITTRRRVTDITWREVEEPRFFRRYMQLKEKGHGIYFKEFGDPRVISRKTGKAYRSQRALARAEKGVKPATELFHFLLFMPTSPYGLPRWISALPSVLGSRELDEVNLNYFKNNVVPPLALLCSGGRLGKGVASKIEQYIDEQLKGKKGLHRILVLEAEGQKAVGEPGPRAVPQVKFVPLRDAQQTDALFQNYDVRNEAKVAMAFRLPRILRGDDSAINRATAWASLRFAEEQVFEPERESFDNVMNQNLLPALGITFWQFRSNAPVVRDPEKMVEMVERLVKVGVLLPVEGRELASDIFNRQFLELAEDWTNQPLPIVLAQLRGKIEETRTTTTVAPEEEVPPGDAKQPRGAPAPMIAAGTPLRSLGHSPGDER